MKEITENKSFIIQYYKNKKRLFIAIIGTLIVEQAIEFSEKISEALKLCSDNFSVLFDASQMHTQSEAVQSILQKAEAKIFANGNVAHVATVLSQENIDLRLQLEVVKLNIHGFSKRFNTIQEAEIFLNNVENQ